MAKAVKRAALFALTDVKFGGWVTYTAHLKAGLEAIGWECALLRVGERTESKGREWSMGLTYQNVSRSRAVELTEIADASIIVAAAPRRVEDTELLLTRGAVWVVHDPTELKGKVKNVVPVSKRPIVVIRKAVAAHVQEAGGKAEFVPHPYMVDPEMSNTRIRHAVSISRVDFDKNIDMIAAANGLLPDGKRVTIKGAENRLYTHHKLDKDVPAWREQYEGEFGGKTMWSGKRTADSAYHVVDMSTIKGDGGGTQYTHLEAFDAGATLILNAGWLTGGEDEVQDAAFWADKPETLALLLGEDSPITTDMHVAKAAAGAAILERHDAATVAKVYEEIATA